MKKNSNKNTENISSVRVLSVMPTGILISVMNKDYFISFNRLPWFQDAKLSDILDVSMFGRMGIKWDKLGVELEIESLEYPEKYPLVIKRSANEMLNSDKQ